MVNNLLIHQSRKGKSSCLCSLFTQANLVAFALSSPNQVDSDSVYTLFYLFTE
nr:hypothetical protein Cduv_298 [Cedratvirus duvanny]